ncbi:MAG: CPBP family intramembrane metalloprotease [Clostridia bacterium]|nr:CPBP family intramembrane metalloprotease [Clostridia bacterium]
MKKKYTSTGVLLSLLKAILYFGLWLLIQFVVVNFAASVIKIKFPSVDDYDLTEMVNGLSLEINIIVGALTVLVLALFAKLQKDTLSKRASINKYAGGFTVSLVIMGIATCYAITLIMGLLEMAHIFPQSWVDSQSSAYQDVFAASPFMQFLSIGFIAPLMEEVLFRGCILGVLKKEMHPWVAIIVSAVLFGVAHGTPIGILYATCLGILMGWLSVTFNSIVPTLIFHMAYNCTVAYSGGVTMGIAVLSLPILCFQIISIKNYFRGKKE